MAVNNVEIKLENNILHVSGDLDFNNVMSLYQQSIQLFAKQSSVITIDFSGLTTTNSVVLALIINWIRYANTLGKTISLQNLSQEVMWLAKGAGLDKVIAPVAAST